jgi:PHD/YefM family antitoxin component YafN of YafNO toxin-antitoxin module
MRKVGDMAPKTGTTNAVAASWLRDNLSEAVSRVMYGGERFVVQRRKKEGVALVSVEDLEFLEELEDKLDLAAAREALSQLDSEGTVTLQDMKRRLGLAN